MPTLRHVLGTFYTDCHFPLTQATMSKNLRVGASKEPQVGRKVTTSSKRNSKCKKLTSMETVVMCHPLVDVVLQLKAQGPLPSNAVRFPVTNTPPGQGSVIDQEMATRLGCASHSSLQCLSDLAVNPAPRFKTPARKAEQRPESCLSAGFPSHPACCPSCL